MLFNFYRENSFAIEFRVGGGWTLIGLKCQPKSKLFNSRVEKSFNLRLKTFNLNFWLDKSAVL